MVKGQLKRIADATADRIASRLSRSFPDIGHQVAAELLLASRSEHTRPCDLFGGVSDELWLWICTQGCKFNSTIRELLPELPSDDIQTNFTGAAGEDTLRDAFRSYTLFRRLYTTCVGPIGGAHLLDFGCGWGRLTRFWIRDVPRGQLAGCDPVEEMVELCRRTNRWAEFRRSPFRPPTDFPDGSFDLIYAFSVFSHLSEEAHLAWLPELARILKPGGIVALTTRGREFVTDVERMRKIPGLDQVHEGPRSSSRAFLDTEAVLADYDAGRFCHTQLVDSGEWSYWGETAIPKNYVMAKWPECGLEIVEFVDDRSLCAQNVIVARKLAR